MALKDYSHNMAVSSGIGSVIHSLQSTLAIFVEGFELGTVITLGGAAVSMASNTQS